MVFLGDFINLNFECNGFRRFNRVTDSQELQQYLFSYCCFFACLSFAFPPFHKEFYYFVSLLVCSSLISRSLETFVLPRSPTYFREQKDTRSYTAREFHGKMVTPFKYLLKKTTSLFIHEKS